MSADQHETFLTTAKVRERYGVSHMFIERRLADAGSTFPRPIYLGRLRFWKLAELEAWERAQALKPPPTKKKKADAA